MGRFRDGSITEPTPTHLSQIIFSGAKLLAQLFNGLGLPAVLPGITMASEERRLHPCCSRPNNVHRVQIADIECFLWGDTERLEGGMEDTRIGLLDTDQRRIHHDVEEGSKPGGRQGLLHPSIAIGDYPEEETLVPKPGQRFDRARSYGRPEMPLAVQSGQAV